MTTALSNLIRGARAATSTVPIWTTDGGRACPIDWDDCSQPVFMDEASGAHDYGDPGGPGHEYCTTECQHKLALPEWAYDDIGDDIWNWMRQPGDLS